MSGKRDAIMSIVVLTALLAFFYGIAEGGVLSSELELTEIRLFESGDTPADRSERRYDFFFPNTSTRYIWCEVNVKNLLHHDRWQSHEVTWRFYDTDRTLMGEQKSTFNIKSDRKYAQVAHLWGWSKPGQWHVGTYAVTVLIDGWEMETQRFSIYNDGLGSAKEGKKELNTFLYTAVSTGDTAHVKNLLAQGADPDQSIKGYTTLMCAAEKGLTDISRILIGNGIEVNMKTAQGMTPLLYAVKNNRMDTVRLLLNHGADISIQDVKGRDALMWAKFENYPEIESLLTKAKTLTLSGTWEGKWTSPSGYVYTFKTLFEVDAAHNVKSGINWTLEVSPRAHERSKIGRKGVEYVKGTYDPNTRAVVLAGYDKNDPHTILGLDRYVLFLSIDGKELKGKTWNHGTWDGKLSAHRK